MTTGGAWDRPKAALVDAGTSDGGGLVHFVTRPDLTPPSREREPLWPGERRGLHLYERSEDGRIARRRFDPQRQRRSGLDLGPSTPRHHRMDVNVQTYRDKRVLTWWEGAVTDGGYGLGVGMIADTSYRTTHVVRAHHGLQADLHEFNLTSQGTALITAYRTVGR